MRRLRNRPAPPELSGRLLRLRQLSLVICNGSETNVRNFSDIGAHNAEQVFDQRKECGCPQKLAKRISSCFAYYSVFFHCYHDIIFQRIGFYCLEVMIAAQESYFI